jgi:hypothetical protein
MRFKIMRSPGQLLPDTAEFQQRAAEWLGNFSRTAGKIARVSALAHRRLDLCRNRYGNVAECSRTNAARLLLALYLF